MLEGQYKTILSDGYSVENIIKNISLIDPSKKFITGNRFSIAQYIHGRNEKCEGQVNSFRKGNRKK